MKYTQIAQISNEDIFYADFKSGGSRNLNVNGSVTPVEFTLEDLTSEKFILTRIDFLISCGTSVDLNLFGSIAALVNGIDFAINGTVTFKNNGDILLFVTDAGTEVGKIEGVDAAFINGHWDTLKSFQNGLVCVRDNFKITVNDNLSAIDYFRISASGIKI